MANNPKIPESRTGIGLYLAAILILVLTEVVAVCLIVILRPNHDNTSLIAIISALIVPIITSILNLVNGHQTRNKVDDSQKEVVELRKEVNGRMTQHVDNVAAKAYAEGEAAARKELQLLMTPPPVAAQPLVAVAPLVPPAASQAVTIPQVTVPVVPAPSPLSDG